MNSKSNERPSTIEPKIEESKSLADPEDVVEHCQRKIAFVREFFCHNVPDDELWTENAKAGFHFILDDLENDLEVVGRQLLERAASEIAGKTKANQMTVEAGNKNED